MGATMARRRQRAVIKKKKAAAEAKAETSKVETVAKGKQKPTTQKEA